MPNSPDSGTGRAPTRQPRPNEVSSGGWTQENQPDWGGDNLDGSDNDSTVVVGSEPGGGEPVSAADAISNNYKDRPDQDGATGAQGAPAAASTPDKFADDKYRPGRPSAKDRKG